MGIKRGVSFYSYQQSQFLKEMNWKDMIREVHDNLGTDGVEIIDEAIIRDYPFPSEQFIYDWNNEMARYNMKAVTMDVYLDVHQFRDHVMTYDEAALRLKNDIILASKLGFENVRCLCLVPIEVIEKALPTAEKYNVRIGKEIHAPLSIKPGASASLEKTLFLDPRSVDQIIELAQKTGSKHVGLVPDMGIFQHSPTQISIDNMLRNSKQPDVIEYILSCRGKMTMEEVEASLAKKYPDYRIDARVLNSLTATKSCSQPEDLLDIVPYILSIHGKFYQMTEVPGKPGHYEDKSIDYANPIKYLKKGGYEGYINSEYEGQRAQQDRGREFYANEVEEVRRHHAMMKELIEG